MLPPPLLDYTLLCINLWNYLAQILLRDALMIISSMWMRMNSIPLCYNHPCRLEHFISSNQVVIDVSGSFMHDPVTSQRRVTFNSNIPDSSLLANVIVTPEWSKNMPLPWGLIVGREAVRMWKLPRIFKRECSIFIDLEKIAHSQKTVNHRGQLPHRYWELPKKVLQWP